MPEQCAEWIDAICSTSTATSDASRAYQFDDGTVAVLPLARRGWGAASSLWSPPPAWGVGGAVGGNVDRTVVAAIVADLRELRVARISVRIDSRHEELWQEAAGDAITIPRRGHIIELADTPDEHFTRLSKTTRRLVRRAAKSGVRIEVDHSGDLLDTHYGLYLTSVERWAEHQHEPRALAMLRAKRRDPIHKLRAMQRALGDRCRVLVSYVDDVPASSGIILLGATTRDTRGAADVAVSGSTGANEAMQWRAINEAFEFGSRRYHLGESGNSEGLAAFKEKFGAVGHEHHEYRFERLPMTRTSTGARTAVKRLIGFND